MAVVTLLLTIVTSLIIIASSKIATIISTPALVNLPLKYAMQPAERPHLKHIIFPAHLHETDMHVGLLYCRLIL
jgi:hypothetical protein